MSQRSWFSVRNSLPTNSDTAEISIYDEIGFYGVTAKDFIRDLKGISASSIDLRINSPGGSVFEGNAIYNALRRHPATITVYVDGIAASIASVVAMAGDTVHMPANAMMMIHNPSGLAVSDAEGMRKNADILDKIKETILAAYVKKTGGGRKVIAQLMDDETWMTAADALELGFADYIDDEVQAAARFELSPSVDTTIGGVKLTDLLSKLAGKQPAVETPEPAPEPCDKLRQTPEALTDTAPAPAPEPAPTPADSEPATVTATVETLGESITNLNVELANARVDIENKAARITELEGEIKTATELANEIVASMPIDTPLPQGNTGETLNDSAKTAEELIEDMKAIDDPAKRTEFFRKHLDLIHASNRELKSRQ